MATIAQFTIIDYDGQTYNYSRFNDGYPSGDAGVFANFPLGDHDFCLETFVRRLALENVITDYFSDISYMLDLRSRNVTVSSFNEDFNFCGTFEEAVKLFAYYDYSEKDAGALFPVGEDLELKLVPALIDDLWDIVNAVKRELTYLVYDTFSPRLLTVGDNVNFFMYQDFVLFPSCSMNENYKAHVDALKNARRLGLRLCFNNTVTSGQFTLYYMLRTLREGYILPCTGKFIQYGERPDGATRRLELKMMVQWLKMIEPNDLHAVNMLHGIM